MKHARFFKQGVIGSALPFFRLMYIYALLICAFFLLSKTKAYAATGFRVTFTAHMERVIPTGYPMILIYLRKVHILQDLRL